MGLSDGSLVNFLYEGQGLCSFGAEYRRARRIRWLGAEVRVLPLARLYASKARVGRPKDLAHLPLFKQTMRLQRRMEAVH